MRAKQIWRERGERRQYIGEAGGGRGGVEGERRVQKRKAQGRGSMKRHGGAR